MQNVSSRQGWPFFLQRGSHFAGTKFSHVIASARLSGMKKLINTSVWKYLWDVPFQFPLCFYDSCDVNLWEKNVLNRISSFYRSSHRRYSAKNVFLIFFVTITLKVLNFIKKRLQRWCTPVNTAKFLRTPILNDWLLFSEK